MAITTDVKKGERKEKQVHVSQFFLTKDKNQGLFIYLFSKSPKPLSKPSKQHYLSVIV